MFFYTYYRFIEARKMSFNIVVLAKQVPDTRNVGKDAMTPQGTVNRAALPAIFNPEDLNALELALRIKDAHPGTKIQIVTMGLPKMGHVDLVIGGRQAIDGDTAQVGPQVAQKLDIDQVTYVEQVEELDEKSVTVTRRIDGGVERVKAPLPVLLTVTGSAAPCRPRNAKLMMKYKRALAPAEQKADMPYAEEYARKPYLTITQWGAADIDADIAQCGLAGSPTKVKTVQNVVFATKESRTLTGSDADVEQLIVELLDSHTIG